MQVKILELLAFLISASSFAYGAVSFFNKKAPKYFTLIVCAVGCYALEELWVIVNSIFGNGIEDGLLTVRLFGLFACFLFMLSANLNEFDKLVDDGKHRKAELGALAAPIVLLAMYLLCVLSPMNELPHIVEILGFLSMAPALFASYYNLKHLLLPQDALDFLSITKGVNIVALILYAACFIYPLANFYLSHLMMSIYDLCLAIIAAILVLECRKGGRKWNTIV